MTIQLNFAKVNITKKENPEELRKKLASAAGCTDMPTIFKGLKPMGHLDPDYDLSLGLLAILFKTQLLEEHNELCISIQKAIRMLVKYYSPKVEKDKSYKGILLRRMNQIW